MDLGFHKFTAHVIFGAKSIAANRVPFMKVLCIKIQFFNSIITYIFFLMNSLRPSKDQSYLCAIDKGKGIAQQLAPVHIRHFS